MTTGQPPFSLTGNRTRVRPGLPLTSWTQQDRSRIPSTPIWSSRVYKRTQDVKSTYQMGPSYLCFLIDPIVRKPSTRPKKIPTCPAGIFLTLPLEPCCARPRFKSLTLPRCAHSASRTQRTEWPQRGYSLLRVTVSRTLIRYRPHAREPLGEELHQ